MEKSRLFEVSWEVCNKVGGIHTVITSKILFAQEEFGDRYVLIGPYINPAEQAYVFTETAIPQEWEDIAKEMKEKYQIELHMGMWNTPGNPQVVLIDWKGFQAHFPTFKQRYWEEYKLDTIDSDFYDYDQPVAWSTAAGLLVEAWHARNPEPCVLHVHEWMSGGALLHINKRYPDIRTIFTTHATVLGRALSARDVPVFNQLESIYPPDEARKVNVMAKHHTEALTAQLATVFTTVSTVTATEAKALLGRKPVVTPNALDLKQFPSMEDHSYKRNKMRSFWNSFVENYFKPFYPIDTTTCHYQFTMGRYEMHNKGYDFHLDALGKLNQQLKDEKSDQTVIAFLLVIGENPPPKDQSSLSAPDLCPYALSQPDKDSILQKAASQGLLNREEDRVKVLLFPTYLDGHDKLLNKPLYDLIAGFDLGIFTSWYEPWGYTPMESMAAGVPAINSNLTGFGQELQPYDLEAPFAGAFLCDRLNQDYSAQIEQLLSFMRMELQSNRDDWNARRYASLLTMKSFTWKAAYKHYLEAYADTPSLPDNS